MAQVDGFHVNFLIAGAQKCGTSALAHFLGQHPEICMAPQKEVHFFDAPAFDQTLAPDELDARYRMAFPNFTGQPLVGEATPSYMFLPGVAERIAAYDSQMRLICLLRDPVARALSHYEMERATGSEKRSLAAALISEYGRLRGDKEPFRWGSAWRDHSYISRGFYGAQIARLHQLFPDRVLVLRMDDLWNRFAGVLGQVYEFLGVADKSFLPERVAVRPDGKDLVHQKIDPGLRMERPEHPFITRLLKLVFARERNALRRMDR